MRLHPLLPYLLDAAEGRFPPADGGVTRVPAPAAGQRAVVSFTGHAVVATDGRHPDLAALGADGYGGALHPRVLTALAGPAGSIGVIDATLVRLGEGGAPRLTETPDHDGHPRVAHARRVRRNVRVFGDARGFVTLSDGLGWRREISIETPAETHGAGGGRALIADALSLVPRGTFVFAAVSPGNARSLRAFLACGFKPIGSEVLILTDESDPGFR